MRFIVLLVLSLGVISSFTGLSQSNSGYFGKKNFIEISTLSATPLVRNLIIDRRYNGYEAKDGVLIESGKYWFQSGIHIYGGRAIKNNFIVGLEFGIDRWKTFAPQMSTFDYEPIELLGPPYYVDKLFHENIVMQRTLIMPKVEIARSSGLLPIGLSYTFGLGFSSVRVVKKDYLMEFGHSNYYNNSYYLTPIPDSLDIQSSDFINYDKKFHGLQIMAGIKMRIPIAARLIFAFGVRYKLDIRLYDTYGYEPENYLSERAAGIGWNIICLEAGFTIPF